MQEKYFKGQKEDEIVIMSIRQHPWNFFGLGVWIIGSVVLYLAVFYFFKSGPVVAWTAFVSFFVIIYFIFRALFIWWNQVYIITTNRLIEVNQNGWFSRSMSETSLRNVLFINHEIKGIIRTILNFGDVRIRTTGVTEDEMVFTNVFNPYEVQQLIVRTQKEGTDSRFEEMEDKRNDYVMR